MERASDRVNCSSGCSTEEKEKEMGKHDKTLPVYRYTIRIINWIAMIYRHYRYTRYGL